MLLRNYDNAMICQGMVVTRGTSEFLVSDGEFGDGSLVIRNVYNNSNNKICNNSYWVHQPLSTFDNAGQTDSFSRGCSNLVIGDGNTPVTYDDFKLESMISGAKVIFASHSFDYQYNEENNTLTSNYKKVFTATENITIKEIGVYSSVPFGTTESKFIPILTYREVLETPIEVAAGSNVVVTFTKKQNLNQNKPADYVATASVE
jgi:hypothetical protein